MTHEIGNILHMFTDETVEVSDIRVGFICRVCGHHWGIRVDDTEDLLKQAQKMVCLPCYQKSISARNVRDVSYDYNEKTQK